MADEPVAVKEFYSYKEFAELFEVEHVTVKKWVDRKKLQPVTVDGQRRLPHSEVIRFAEFLVNRDGCEELDRKLKETKKYIKRKRNPNPHPTTPEVRKIFAKRKAAMARRRNKWA